MILRRALLAACVAGTSATALAQQNAPPPPSFAKVLSAVTLDLDDDAAFDRAVLVQGDDDEADLYLYLSSAGPQGDPPVPTLALTKPHIAFSGSSWGQQPTLEVNGKGSLVIVSTNTGIGRNHWDLRVTVVYRANAAIVAGVTYVATDTLDPKGGGRCDLDLLSGKGTRNGNPTTVPKGPLRLADWSDDNLPAACQF